jgi:hypothetical protein
VRGTPRADGLVFLLHRLLPSVRSAASVCPRWSRCARDFVALSESRGAMLGERRVSSGSFLFMWFAGSTMAIRLLFPVRTSTTGWPRPPCTPRPNRRGHHRAILHRPRRYVLLNLRRSCYASLERLSDSGVLTLALLRQSRGGVGALVPPAQAREVLRAPPVTEGRRPLAVLAGVSLQQSGHWRRERR